MKKFLKTNSREIIFGIVIISWIILSYFESKNYKDITWEQVKQISYYAEKIGSVGKELRIIEKKYYFLQMKYTELKDKYSERKISEVTAKK